MTRDARVRAIYDAEGNIILLASGEPALPPAPRQDAIPAQVRVAQSEPPPAIPAWLESENPLDAVLLEQTVPVVAEKGPDVTALVARGLTLLRHSTHDAMAEGFQQVVSSMEGTGPVLRDVGESATRGGRALWSFLAQPVWIPTRKKSLKQYSRGTLFLLDVIRFGATFAMIFAGLFVALNYQSFWQIASAQVDRLLTGATVDAPGGADGVNRDVVAALVAQGKKAGDLLSYLPTVGPPENRIVIPKLHLNVPLVNPSYDALLAQDWTQVETDIQNALQLGVVHYPGTGRPGQAGNFFVTGHSSYYPWAAGDYKTVFARLHELQPGDEYVVYYGGDKHRYVVRNKKEVLPSDVTVLDQPADSRVATLMTCTPIGTTLRRLIVRAEEVDPETGAPLRVGQRATAGLQQRPQLEALPI